jgi:collagenase-like PrtC family protease
MTAFNVPFLPDEKYVRFLADHIDALAAVHFPLQPESPFDARHASGSWSLIDLKTHLSVLHGTLRYALLNSRVVPSSLYRDSEELHLLAEQLDDLLAANLLDGIIIADFFLLQTLGRYAPDTAAALEAVPSVNCILSSFDRVSACLEVIDTSRFRRPSKIPLAPCLNRQPSRLQETVTKCRKTFPEMKVELLVNEGCLFQCPFKLAHDAGIALSCREAAAWSLPHGLGCFAILRNDPARLFKSPFIRPEDLHHYQYWADILKICGRTLGPEFLIQTIDSYINEKHEGNLLSLLDAMEWLGRELYIDNRRLAEDFLEILFRCDKQCEQCSTCYNFLRSARSPLPLHLKDLRNRG